MTEETTQDGKSQTAGSENAEQTKEETYSKAQLTELISKEVGKVVAKHSKKYDDLKAELEAEKRKALPDPEKIKAELADKEKAIADREKELSGAKLENAKLRALMKAGVDAEKADSLMKRIIGSTPEEIDADVQELKALGLISQASKGLGTTTTTGAAAGKQPTLAETIAALAEKTRDPTLSKSEKKAIAEKLVDLQTQKMLADAKERSSNKQ
jgi:hypothetical protein